MYRRFCSTDHIMIQKDIQKYFVCCILFYDKTWWASEIMWKSKSLEFPHCVWHWRWMNIPHLIVCPLWCILWACTVYTVTNAVYTFTITISRVFPHIYRGWCTTKLEISSSVPLTFIWVYISSLTTAVSFQMPEMISEKSNCVWPRKPRKKLPWNILLQKRLVYLTEFQRWIEGPWQRFQR